MFEVYGQLLRLRVRWYGVVTARLLHRHWQWLLLAVMLVPMGATGTTLLRCLAYPLRALLAPGQGWPCYFGNIFLIQGLAMAWAGLQRRQIGGGSFMYYAATLPVPAATRWAVELTLLLLANSVLVVPAIAALLLTMAAWDPHPTESVAPLLSLFALTLAAQLAVLEKRPLAVGVVVLADWMLALSLARGVDSPAMVLQVLALPIGSLVLTTPWPERKIAGGLAPFLHSPPSRANYRRFGLPASVCIQLKALANEPAVALLRTIAVLGLAVGAGFLIRAFQFDGRSLPTVVFAMGVIGLIIAGSYRTLETAHARMRLYQATLPVSRYYWAIRDTALILFLGSVPGAILICPLIIRGLVAITTLVVLTVAYYTLLAVLRPSLLLAGRQAVLVSVFVAIGWAAAVLAAVGD